MAAEAGGEGGGGVCSKWEDPLLTKWENINTRDTHLPFPVSTW